jgi:hypothetical protein
MKPVEALTDVVEIAAYRPRPPEPALSARAEALLREVPRAPLHLSLPDVRIARPRLTRPESLSVSPAERDLMLLAAIVMGVAGYGITAMISVLLNGRAALQPAILLGPVLTIALVLALGGAAVAWLGARLARSSWPAWVALGGIGMTLAAGLAVAVGQTIALVLLEPRSEWWPPPNLIAALAADLPALLVLGLPVGLVLGVLFFAFAGWAWPQVGPEGEVSEENR